MNFSNGRKNKVPNAIPLHADEGRQDPLTAGFTTSVTSNLMIPADLAHSLHVEAETGSQIWTALSSGFAPDGARFFKQEIAEIWETDQDEAPETVLTSEPVAPSTTRYMKLNPVQVDRVDGLVKHFSQTKDRPRYCNGQIHSDPGESSVTLQVERREKEAWISHIGRNPQSTSTFGSAFGEARGKRDEHNVLDTFLVARKKIKGFRRASARRIRKAMRTEPPFKLAPAPIPYTGAEPPLLFNPPMLERPKIKLNKLCNALVLGGTNSGKTMSFIKPVLLAMLAYRNEGKAASIVVIDPKSELLASIRRKLEELGELDRLVVIGECGPIQYFDDSDGLTVEDRFAKVNQFIVKPAHGDDGRWQAMAERLVVSFLKDATAFADVTGVGLLESLACIVSGDDSYLNRNQWIALRFLLNRGMDGLTQLRHLCDVYDVLCYGVGLTKIERPLARYTTLKDPDQFFFNARGALILVDLLGSADLEPLLDLTVQRGVRTKGTCNIAQLIETGAVIVFQPQKKKTHDLVGSVLKSLFFRCAMQRSDMTRSLGYFCDEAQRFVTTDDETGEHAFLDRARAYRVTAVLGTQSMASLQAAVGGGIQSMAAIESILVNTPTKVCFRSTDNQTLQTMRAFIPSDPRGLGHVLSTRPPSTLQIGECYYSIGHEWGRYRYQLGESLEDVPSSIETTEYQGEHP